MISRLFILSRICHQILQILLFAKVIENLGWNFLNEANQQHCPTLNQVEKFSCGAALHKLRQFKLVHLGRSSFLSLYLLPSLNPTISLLYWKVPRVWQWGTGTRRCSGVLGHMVEGKAEQWQLAYHIRGCLYMCVCTHVCSYMCVSCIHGCTIIRTLQSVSHKAAAARAHRLEACNIVDAISE